MKKLWDDFLNCISRHRLLIYLTSILCLSLYVLKSEWTDFLNRNWVSPIMSKCEDVEPAIVLTYLGVLLLIYIRPFIKQRVLDYRRMRIFFLLTVLYFYFYFLYRDVWNYSELQISVIEIPWIHFFLLPWLFEILLLVCICIRKQLAGSLVVPILESQKLDLGQDAVKNAANERESTVDSYQRHSFCQSTYEVLKTNFFDERSFVVGITGPWGSGKTTFINDLNSLIQTQGKQEIDAVLFFEPWRYDDSDSLLTAFFNKLKSELNPFIPGLTDNVNRYLSVLINEQTPYLVQVVGNFLRMRDHSDKVDPYSKIKSLLKKAKHRTLVFIDDIDRLDENEIKEVLRLVRNTADFPYMQFIVTLDKEYVINTLSRSGLHSPERYLEKFFDVEIPLPKFENRIICRELLKRLSIIISEKWKIDKDDVRIHDMVYYQSEDQVNAVLNRYLVPSILFTMRDVIRFSNSFAIIVSAYEQNGIINEVAFQDLFYLELLRFRFRTCYELIRDKPLTLLKLSLDGDTFAFDEPSQDENSANRNEIASEMRGSEEILYYLFMHSQRNHSISNIRDYYKYFMFRLDGKILSESEYLSMIGMDNQKLIETVNRFNREKYPMELESQTEMMMLTTFQNTNNQVADLIARILVLDTHTQVKRSVLNAVKPRLCSTIFESKEMLSSFLNFYKKIRLVLSKQNFKYNDFIRNLLDLRSYSFESLSDAKVIVEKFLSEESDQEIDFSSAIVNTLVYKPEIKEYLLLDAQTLIEVQINYFKRFPDKLSKKGIALFQNCITGIEQTTGHLMLHPDVLPIMKNAILVDPATYLDSFIVERNNKKPDDGSRQLDCRPFYKDIFETDENFKKFLEAQKMLPMYDRVHNFFELYEYNGCRPLSFPHHDIKKMIKDSFTEQMEQLEILKSISIKVEELHLALTPDEARTLKDCPLDIAFKHRLMKKVFN